MIKSSGRNLQPPTLWRAALEAGADLLQMHPRLEGFDIFVASLHCVRHHFCRRVNPDFN